MANKRLLINREWHIDGCWYAPRDFLRDKFASVVFCEHFNTTSSAGDWVGIVLQQFGKKLYAILFFQENSYPSNGFSLSTAGSFMVFPNIGDNPDYRATFDEAVQVVTEMYY